MGVALGPCFMLKPRSNATVEPRSAAAYMATCMVVGRSHVDQPTGTSVCGGVRTTKSDAKISSRQSKSDTKNSIRQSTRSSDAKNSIRQPKSDAKNSIRRSGQSALARRHERWTTKVRRDIIRGVRHTGLAWIHNAIPRAA